MLQRLFISAFICVAFALPLHAAADRERVQAFLTTTGFDVAVASISQSASHAPAMLGLEAADFGADWSRLADTVFEPKAMTRTAADILAQAMDDEMLAHGAEFYASDLGARLVVAENASHSSDGAERVAQGKSIVATLQTENPGRLALFERMNKAIDAGNMSVRAMEEIQLRFLSGAAAADVIQLKVDEAQLRALIAEGREALTEQMAEGAIAGAAWTYQSFTDAEITQYAEALEHPTMQKIYELMNAVQYEIMANRFETLAVRMNELHPGQDL